jgi:hypothetical protein
MAFFPVPSVPFWDDGASGVDAWDRLEINSLVFEKTNVEVDGDFGNEWDVKKSPGADGAPATNKGYEPCKPKVSWLLWTIEHFDTYAALLDKVQSKPGKAPPVVLEVIHPQLQLVKKSRFRIAKIHLLKKVGPQQMQACFELLEYFDSPKPIPKPDANVRPPDDKRERAVYDIDFKPSKTVKP